MEKNLQLYLHFIGNTDDTDQWSSEFSYYFSVVAKQILGYSPTLFSNVDTSGTKPFVYKSVDDFIDKDAVIFILNLKPKDSDFDFIVNLLPDISFLNIFLVLRTRPKNLVIHESIRTIPSYNFYDSNPYNFEITEFMPDGQGEMKNEFWDKMTDLAYDVKLKCSTKNVLELSSDYKKTVFLAEVSVDQTKNRERLLRELLLSGYRVLPEKPLPSSLIVFEEAVIKALSECSLSINIMGEVYGESPDGSDYSYVEIQNRLYSKECLKTKEVDDEVHNIHRIVWFSPIFEPFEDKQNQYLKRLKKEILSAPNTELIHSTLYDLKSIIDQKFAFFLLNHDVKPFDNLKSVLVITDEHDSNIIHQVEEKLHKMDVEYVTFAKLLKETNQIISKIDTFKKYCNFLVVSTKSNDLWVNSITSILIRSKVISNSDQKSIISLLIPNSNGKLPECIGVNLSSYIYDKENIDTVIDSLISRLKT